MATTFAGQKKRIKLLTEVVLTGYTCLIKYIRPDGVTGSWSASIDAGNNQKMYYDALPSVTNYVGYWWFWAYYSAGADDIGIGEIVREEFVEEGHAKHI